MDKPDSNMIPNFQIATSQTQPVAAGSRHSIDRRIRAFLNGESHGEDVLGALYGGVAAEPIPPRLLTLLKP